MHRCFALALLVALAAGCASTSALERGAALAEATRWDEAVQAYLEALKDAPGSIEARMGLARALANASEVLTREGARAEAAGRIADAAAAYARAQAYNAENVRAREGGRRMADRLKARERLARGRDLLAAGRLREAAQELVAARRLDPGNPEVRAVLDQATAELRAEMAAVQGATEDASPLALFPPESMTLRFRDAELRDVLEAFGRLAGVNVFLDDGAQQRRISFAFQDLRLRDGFELFLQTNRLFAKRIAPNAILVIPDTLAKHQQYDELVVETFFLNDADATSAVGLLRTMLGTRQIHVNERLNALVVRETPEKLALARKLLDANDRGPAEVEIQLEVLEVNRTRLENLGVQMAAETYAVTLGLPWRATPLSRVGDVAGRATLTVAPDPTLILNLAKSDSDTKTLATPTVRVLDRQKARVLIGERRPFQISSVSSNTGTTDPGTAPGTITETRVEFRDVGLKLSLAPIISPAGDVTVELQFEISSVGAPIPGVSDGALLVPINTRNLDTFIRVKDGETRLLGGLIQDTASEERTRVPILGDLPLIGRLFRNKDWSKTRTDVLISLTPRIVKALDLPEPELIAFPSGTAEGFGGDGFAVPGGLPPGPAPGPLPAPPVPGVRPRGSPTPLPAPAPRTQP